MTTNDEKTPSPPPSDPPVAGDAVFPRGLSLGVFVPALVLVGAVLVWGLGFTDSFQSAATAAFDWTARSVDWLFVLAATVFVAFVLWLALSKYGNVRLGGDAERPQFRTTSWISMMFAAGMGIGLMFYGCLLYTSPSPRDGLLSRMPSSA